MTYFWQRLVVKRAHQKNNTVLSKFCFDILKKTIINLLEILEEIIFPSFHFQWAFTVL